MSDLIKDIVSLSPEKRELLLQRLKQKKDSLSPPISSPPIKVGSQSQESNTFPLSFAQQRLWFLEQLEPGNTSYNQPIAIRLTGTLNLAAFEQSLSEIGRRHKTLRTIFTLVEGKPVQVIQPTSNLKLPVVDLRALPSAEQEREVRYLAVEEAQRAFNLAGDSLLRGTLLWLDTEEHVLLFTMHHIISDAWSKGIFIRELATLYSAFLAKQPSPLPELSIQYADFAVWQRQWLQGEVLETQLAYWRQQLQDSPPALDFPMSKSRPAVRTFRGTTQSLQLPKDLTEALKDLGKEEKATLFMTLLAAFKALLYRYTGQDDVLVGSPIANRNRSEIEGLIGFFTNTLVMRTHLKGNLSFRDVLGRVRKVALEAYAHQDLPFERLVNELNLQRDLSYTPLFQVLFSLNNTPKSSLEVPGLTLNLLSTDSDTAKFDLSLLMQENEHGLSGSLEYNTDLFDADTIARMLDHFRILLRDIVTHPDKPLEFLQLLTADEKLQQLVEWNQTRTVYSKDACIHRVFEAQVKATPDAVAVVFENQPLTYYQLNQRANRLAHYLRSLGVRPDVSVGIGIERSLEMLVGLLGILKVGAAYVPLDPSYPTERLGYMLMDSGVEVLLTQQSLLDAWPQNQAQEICLDKDWETIERYSSENPDVEVFPDNLAYVIYTSGSTGQPKGIALSHRALNNLIQWHLGTMAVGVGVLQFASLSFDASFHEMFAAWCSGGTLFLIPEDYRLDLDKLVQFLAEKSIRKVTLPVVLWQQLAEVYANQPQVFASLTEAISTGEQLQITQKMIELFSCLDRCTLHNHYGPSETHVVTSYTFIEAPQEWSIYPPIGKPIANTQAYILDSNLQLLPTGVPGELYMGGVGLARGYFNRPALTAEKFIPNPFAQANLDAQDLRLYRTGDLARYLPDGNIEFLGRIDNQVKIRGFRIELGEVESLLNTHPQIQQAVVVALEDVVVDSKRLVAYVIAADKTLKVSQLRTFLLTKLPQYMVPSAFVMLETLPLTPSGKVDRRALPAPDGEISRDHEYVAPRTQHEVTIANVFASLLGVKDVGIHDNFFEMGAHSLLMVKVHNQLTEQLSIDVSLLDLFRYPTISSLVDYLNSNKAEVSSTTISKVETEKIMAGKTQQRKRRQRMKSV